MVLYVKYGVFATSVLRTVMFLTSEAPAVLPSLFSAASLFLHLLSINSLEYYKLQNKTSNILQIFNHTETLQKTCAERADFVKKKKMFWP